MTKTILHRGKEYQLGKTSNLYLPTHLRKQVDPTLPEKAWRRATKPILIGTALATLGGTIIPAVANAKNIVSVEQNSQGDENQKFAAEKTRIKAGVGPAAITYDLNNKGEVDEAKLWVNALSQNGWYAGFLVEGQTDNGNKSYADIGGCVSKNLGSKTIEAFIGPTVQPNVDPVMFYQLALRQNDGKGNLVMALVDDRAIKIGTRNLDTRMYISGQIDNVFAGLGTKEKGIFEKVTKVYGAGGFKTQDLGVGGVFNYEPQNQEGFFKLLGGVGNPSGVFNIKDLVNLWNDIQGPGVRDIGQPYFSSFLTKGDLSGKLEGNINATNTDLKAMIGKDLDLFRLGLGINYHNESGVRYGGLIHVAKSVSLGELGDFYVEGRHNTRDGNTQVYTIITRSF